MVELFQPYPKELPKDQRKTDLTGFRLKLSSSFNAYFKTAELFKFTKRINMDSFWTLPSHLKHCVNCKGSSDDKYNNYNQDHPK